MPLTFRLCSVFRTFVCSGSNDRFLGVLCEHRQRDSDIPEVVIQWKVSQAKAWFSIVTLMFHDLAGVANQDFYPHTL